MAGTEDAGAVAALNAESGDATNVAAAEVALRASTIFGAGLCGRAILVTTTPVSLQADVGEAEAVGVATASCEGVCAGVLTRTSFVGLGATRGLFLGKHFCRNNGGHSDASNGTGNFTNNLSARQLAV